MEMMLAENIRMYRKRKRLTQEQLAEDLGVTSGAVYKWEAKLSVPELNMIIVIADYFDTSVDALLGYTMKDNRLSVTVQRLKEYRIKKEYIGLAEAEKALKKFPHAFEVVHESAILYRVFGMERHAAMPPAVTIIFLARYLSFVVFTIKPVFFPVALVFCSISVTSSSKCISALSSFLPRQFLSETACIDIGYT